MTVSLYRVEGSAIVGDALTEKKCMLDWQPMTVDGVVMVERAAWTLNQSGNTLTVECQEDLPKPRAGSFRSTRCLRN